MTIYRDIIKDELLNHFGDNIVIIDTSTDDAIQILAVNFIAIYCYDQCCDIFCKYNLVATLQYATPTFIIDMISMINTILEYGTLNVTT